MPTSTLTSKGQIALPKEIRDRLGLQPGDVLHFHFNDQGKVEVSPPAGSVLERVSGILKHLAPEPPPSVEEMKKAVRQRAVDKYRRAGK